MINIQLHTTIVMIFYYSGDGGWDSTEVVVAQESRDGHITCHSSHLTCFIVLVDVSRGSDSQVYTSGIQIS